MNKSWEELGKRKSQLEEKGSVLKETAGFFNEVSRLFGNTNGQAVMLIKLSG